MSQSEKSGAENLASLFVFVVLLFLIAWCLVASVATLFGPIVPNTWNSVFAFAGFLLAARFISAGARSSGK